MPRNTGVGRKKKKKKVTTEVTAEGGAAAVGEVPDAEAQSKKRTRQSRKKAPPPPAPLQPPAYRTFEQVQDYSWVVRASAAALENASFVLELAEERHRRQLAKGVATVERLRKLRAKPGVRSTKWTRDWQLTLDELEAEEIKLDGELQLRLDEVEACKRTLARQEESFVELRREWEAWHEYEKARMERRLEEKQRESDGSSPDSDSDSDSDELLTLDELMGKCVVDFDREAHAGPS